MIYKLKYLVAAGLLTGSNAMQQRQRQERQDGEAGELDDAMLTGLAAKSLLDSFFPDQSAAMGGNGEFMPSEGAGGLDMDRVARIISGNPRLYVPAGGNEPLQAHQQQQAFSEARLGGRTEQQTDDRRQDNDDWRLRATGGARAMAAAQRRAEEISQMQKNAMAAAQRRDAESSQMQNQLQMPAASDVGATGDWCRESVGRGPHAIMKLAAAQRRAEESLQMQQVRVPTSRVQAEQAQAASATAQAQAAPNVYNHPLMGGDNYPVDFIDQGDGMQQVRVQAKQRAQAPSKEAQMQAKEAQAQADPNGNGPNNTNSGSNGPSNGSSSGTGSGPNNGSSKGPSSGSGSGGSGSGSGSGSTSSASAYSTVGVTLLAAFAILM